MTEKKYAMDLNIITGMSGAGKSNVIRLLEDLGYYCVDNLPPELFIRFVDLLAKAGFDKVSIVVDIRSESFFLSLYDILAQLKGMQIDYRIVFLDASDEVLVRRYKETRRRHPLADEGTISNSIKEERKRLRTLRGMADTVLDTSDLSISQLHDRVYRMFNQDSNVEMAISIMSFGYKYGIPIDADLVMDVRFLPNPFYVPQLKLLTGKDEEVYDYVISSQDAKIFVEKYFDLLKYILPLYLAEGKHHLTIAIGCTGGRHRSVALVIKIGEMLQQFLANQPIYSVVISHRDMDKVKVN